MCKYSNCYFDRIYNQVRKTPVMIATEASSGHSRNLKVVNSLDHGGVVVKHDMHHKIELFGISFLCLGTFMYMMYAEY